MNGVNLKNNKNNSNLSYFTVTFSIFLIAFIMINNNLSPSTIHGQEQSQTKSNFSAIQNDINKDNKIIQQGTITSIPNPWPGHEGHHIATILSPKSNNNSDSNTVLGYTGILTYTSSKPVQIVVLHKYSIEQSKIDINKFGSGLVTPINNNTYDLTVIQPPYNSSVPTYSDSIPFTGDGIVLHSFGDPFVATYRVSVDVDEANTMNNIETSNNHN
jgi:hypothetical protein